MEEPARLYYFPTYHVIGDVVDVGGLSLEQVDHLFGPLQPNVLPDSMFDLLESPQLRLYYYFYNEAAISCFEEKAVIGLI